MSGDCGTNAIDDMYDLGLGPVSQLRNSKVALGSLAGAHAQSVCGAPSCATLIFGQTKAACLAIRNYSPAVAILPAQPATTCVQLPTKGSVRLETESGSGSGSGSWSDL